MSATSASATISSGRDGSAASAAARRVQPASAMSADARRSVQPASAMSADARRSRASITVTSTSSSCNPKHLSVFAQYLRRIAWMLTKLPV
jgi:hypothetical protein